MAAGIADTAKVELACMIGVPQPCAINIELNRNQEQSDRIITWIREHIDLSPKGIMERFDASMPRYNMVTQFGHFGISDAELINMEGKKYFPWEKTDIAADLAKAILL